MLMQQPSFNLSRVPRIVFGPDKVDALPNLILEFGPSVLLVTGQGSYKAAGKWNSLVTALDEKSITTAHVTVQGEPTPEFVDDVAAEYRSEGIDVVVGIGGGSALDAGKAISAMIPQAIPVVELLEGVGTGATHDGRKIPFIAVPTTAGTGSEATKNAVLRRVGDQGFKNSLRHENLVPDIALIDPELQLTCPREVTAACGLDAFTQLLEAYTSNIANDFTDALALSGLRRVVECLVPAASDGAENVDIRGGMAYGALLSGICLANAGLGIVHGLASPIGGFFDIPHGVVCGTLLAVATRVNVETLSNKFGSDHPALRKYADVGNVVQSAKEKDTLKACEMLVQQLESWTETLQVPRLSSYGVTADDVDRIVAKAGNKNNPITLDSAQIQQILEERI